MKAAYKAALANLEQAKWNLSKTKIYAPTDGYITNLQARVGNYANAARLWSHWWMSIRFMYSVISKKPS